MMRIILFLFLILPALFLVAVEEDELTPAEKRKLIEQEWNLRNFRYNTKYHIKKGQWDEAMYTIQKILEMKPDDKEARAMILEIEEKRWAGFEKQFDDKSQIKKTVGIKLDWNRIETFGEEVVNICTEAMKYYKLAEDKFTQGNLDIAEAYYKMAITRHAKFSTAYRRLGEVYLIRDDIKLSKYCLGKAIDYRPDDVQSRMFLANIFLVEKDFDNAEGYLNSVISISPGSELSALAKGLIYRLEREKAVLGIMAEQKIDAEQFIELSTREERKLAGYAYGHYYYLEKGRKANPDYWFSYYLISNAHMMTFKKKEALASMDRAIELAAGCYTDHLKKIREEMKDRKLRPYQFDSLEFHVARAEMLYNKKYYTEAIGELVVALSLSPNSSRAHVMMGRCFSAMNNFTRSISEFRQAISMDPKNFEAHFMLGKEYLKLHQYEDAMDSLKNAILLEPDNVDAMIRLGEAYMQVEDYQSVIETLKKAKRIDPEEPTIYFHMGYVYSEQAEFEKAIEQFEKVIELQEDYYEAYMNMGITHYKLWEAKQDSKHLEKAIEYTEIALKYEPDNPVFNDYLNFFKSMK